MKAHFFLNFISLVTREKDELDLSSESVTSIKKPVNPNPLKVVYHPLSCLLHHYIIKKFCKPKQEVT